MESTTPEGWYTDPHDPRLARWWDGTRWTEHTSPLQPPVAEPAPQTSPPAPEPDPYPVERRAAQPFTAAGGERSSASGSWMSEPVVSRPAGAGGAGARRVVLLVVAVLALIVTGAAVWFVMSNLATEVEDVGTQATGSIDEANDLAAWNDVQQLQTALTVYLSSDPTAELPTITADGSTYSIQGASGSGTTVGMSSGVTFGGFEGTSASEWCVWVTSSSGVAYQGEPGKVPTEGSCG